MFFHLLLKLPSYLLVDAGLRIFPTSYATTENQTHVGSVAPSQGTLIQDALTTELVQPRLPCLMLLEIEA